VGRDDLDEEKEGLRVGVVVFLKLCGDRLQVLGVGCKVGVSKATEGEN
jgi:hypothetical protein